MVKPNLSVTIGKLKLNNPVIAASGTFGYGEEYKDLVPLEILGAIITKSITLNPKKGNPPPRIIETASGMLNAIGLQNEGVENFIKEKVPYLKKLKVPVIVSIAGEKVDEYEKLARILDAEQPCSAIEVNIYCPNVKYGERLFAQDAAATFEVVSAVRKATNLTVIAKLSPNVTDIAEIAKAAQDAGADSVSLINTITALCVDIKTRTPKLANVTGGLSGPAVKPVALRMVYEAKKKIKIPIIGIGGIMTADDAIEFLLCGAAAVQIGTGNFVDPKASAGIVKGIQKYLTENKINDVNSIVGALNPALPETIHQERKSWVNPALPKRAGV